MGSPSPHQRCGESAAVPLSPLRPQTFGANTSSTRLRKRSASMELLDHVALMARSSLVSISIAAQARTSRPSTLSPSRARPAPASGTASSRSDPPSRRLSPKMIGRPCRGRACAPSPDMPLEYTEDADRPLQLPHRVEVKGYPYVHGAGGIIRTFGLI